MGRLRISAMVGFGEKILLPLLDEFSALYPQIVLDVSLSDELSTLGRDDVDIAIRGGYAPNERVIAKRLMDNSFIPVASPHYLEAHGVPSHVLELREHKGLYFKTPYGRLFVIPKTALLSAQSKSSSRLFVRENKSNQ